MKIFLLILSLFLFVSLLTHAEEIVPENFGCFVRYNLRGFRPNEGRAYYKDYNGEKLPPSYLVRDSNGRITRVVKGSVKYLPYLFTIKVTKKDKTDPGIIETDIVDPMTNKSLPGFPSKIPNTMKVTSNVDDESVGFEFKVSPLLKDKIAEHYLAPLGYSASLRDVVGVILMVGVGESFFKEVDYFTD